MNTWKETSGTSLRAQRASTPRVETAVTLRSESHFFVDRRSDTRGVFVATQADLAVGQEILVELALHSYVLLLRGSVLWRSAGGNGVVEGIGIGFHDLTVPARWVIDSFCTRRPAVPYDLDERRNACG